MKQRNIRQIVTGTAQIDGAGVHLVRVIGHADVKDFDPFLMLDAFDSVNPADYIKGFPWHPHRGIETVTYLVQGEIEHGDSLGNKGVIRDGGCQWMTAGSGIIHQEMPLAAPRMLGLQLWLNLPAKDKMTAPKYRDLTEKDIPVFMDGTSRIGVIAGRYKETDGAMQGEYVDARFLDITVQAGQKCVIQTPGETTVFIYILQGALSFGSAEGDGDSYESHRAVLFLEGDQVTLTASTNGAARCVFFEGKPLHEPIAWGGPIVMNTQAELDSAFRELDEGTFIKR